MPMELHAALRKVFKYLKWKVQHYPETFNQEDTAIISGNMIDNYFDLSTESCKYTRGMMKKYTEFLWTQKITYEFQADGHAFHPKPKCEPLPIPIQVSRLQEVQIMSLFYENNLLNGFLHKYNNQKFPNPLCHCGDDIQTNYHIVMGCSITNQVDNEELINELKTLLGGNEVVAENYYLFLNASKSEKVISLLIKNIEMHKDNLRTDIEL